MVDRHQIPGWLLGVTFTIPVQGISIGHFTDRDGLTGCTVVLAPAGVTASVDIRGGAPGTLETALLSPFAAVGELHGLLLTGGSAPGLGAAAGVSAFLRERGHGYRTPYARVPLVAGAVIYDLGLGRAAGLSEPGGRLSGCRIRRTRGRGRLGGCRNGGHGGQDPGSRQVS